jgi:hypothetical protein
MKEHTTLIVASILAVLLALYSTVRITVQKASFSHTVTELLKTTEGYDEKFINMVNKLEEVLANRASFGYSGGKDPMTGKTRVVVEYHRPAARHIPTTAQPSGTALAPAPVEAAADPVRLTAIIFDDEKKDFTAIVMDGERSYSVEVGDHVRDRKITKITKETLFMESGSELYKYDIYGNSASKKKDGSSPDEK